MHQAKAPQKRDEVPAPIHVMPCDAQNDGVVFGFRLLDNGQMPLVQGDKTTKGDTFFFMVMSI